MILYICTLHFTFISYSTWVCFCFKVCGGHGNAIANSSCPDSPCGGAGCRDNQGALKCGGRGCNGTVGASVVALGHADDVRTNLTAASEELQAMLKKVNMFSCAVYFYS